MIYRIIFSLTFWLFSVGLRAQQFDVLIHHAWNNDHQLKAKTFQLKSAETSYLEAKAMYGPTLSFGLQYTLAAGGRTIDLPVGDLLNPVYGTLNQITQSNSFPQIENTSVQFLPNNFYDAKLSFKQPIYYPDLNINKEVKATQMQTKELEIKAYKRLVSKEVMMAYMQLESGKKAVEIYKSGLVTLDEAIRTTKSMIANGIASPLALSRIENQRVAIESQLIEAETNKTNAELFLRFVSSWPSNKPIPAINLATLPDSLVTSKGNREELSLINQGIALNELGIKKEKQFYMPKIGAGVDIGSQDFNFGWQPYGILGLNVDVMLYDHKRHKIKQDAYRAEQASYQAQHDHAIAQFELAASVAFRNLTSAISQAKNVEPRVSIARKVYNDALKRYKEGITNYLEVIDAQSQITQMELQSILAQNKAWMKWAEYFYATASYQIP